MLDLYQGPTLFMATMIHRPHFAFDQNTICCSLFQAEERESKIQVDPIKMLALFHASGEGLSENVANSYLKEASEDRKHWRSE